MIRISDPDISRLEYDYVNAAMDEGWIGGNSPWVEDFEQAIAGWLGVGADRVIACSSGTTALHLALIASGIGPGDEVVLPDLTYAATAAAVVHAGGGPVLVDVDDNGLIRSDLVAAAITDRTKAVIAVDLYGQVPDYDGLRRVINGKQIALIEDAAEAHGALSSDRRMAGTLADIGCLSFYANKILTCGEGGAVIASGGHAADVARLYRGQGQSAGRRYWHEVAGYNYRLGTLQSAIGRAQVERVDELLTKRRVVEQWYAELGMTTTTGHLGSAPWLMNVDHVPGDDERFAAAQIETRPWFHPLHIMPPYERCRFVSDDNESNSQRLHDQRISLPLHTGMTRDDVRAVVSASRGSCAS